MSFDMRFDFCQTNNFVTHPAFSVVVLNTDTYPTTYTSGNGLSSNAGWDTAIGGSDRDNTVDHQLASINYNPNQGNGGGVALFKIDLSSGSAPGAGTFLVDFAFGDPTAQRLQDFQIRDTNTVLIDGTNGGAGYSTLAGHYIDATLTDVAAAATWTGTSLSETFATTLAQVAMSVSPTTLIHSSITHFRLTVGSAAKPWLYARQMRA